MNFLKSESYSLSPDEYLQKFKTPHSVISLKGSLQSDEKDIKNLNQILVKYFNDDEQTSTIKQKIVEQMKAIVSDWMKQIAEMSSNHKWFDFQQLQYGLKVFGSYRLRTNSYDGDIDMLCIVPEFFNRDRHFFNILYNKFKEHEQICETFTIPDAIVPLMRLTIYGVQIDLLLSIIPQQILRRKVNFFQSDDYEDNWPINPQQLRSINGYRTAMYFKNIFVKKYKNYRITLKALKLWSKNKGVYSQIYGYLGGAGFSIMLAKICQLYPNYTPLQLLDRFFFIYSNWAWSIPVIIEKMKTLEKPLESQMAILTPLEPHMNAGHYLSKITSNITKKHLRQTSKLVQDINKYENKEQKLFTWQNLFKPFNFFEEYKNFIEISVMGESAEDYIPWKGNVESKLRKFIQILQQLSEINQLTHGLQLNPYPKAFPSKHSSFRYCSKYYIGIKCLSNSILNDFFEIDLTQSVRTFLEQLENYPQIDKAPKQINIGFSHQTNDTISADVLQFFKQMFRKK